MFKFTPLIEKALRIAYTMHEGQDDKCDVPYIFHPYNVAERCAIFYDLNKDNLPDYVDYETLICLALLHDVIEDTDWTIADFSSDFLRKNFFIESINLLTHTEPQPRSEYIDNILNCYSIYPLIVKLMDLIENMRPDRKTDNLAKQEARNQIYQKDCVAIFAELCRKCPNDIAYVIDFQKYSFS